MPEKTITINKETFIIKENNMQEAYEELDREYQEAYAALDTETQEAYEAADTMFKELDNAIVDTKEDVE